mmetsp:Transcript_15884/g.18266  ORF Transcript_15884/g.18266 Transcript_15884/m.18266 type:complete len:203 (+) Transcript_15884:884-1492(+)
MTASSVLPLQLVKHEGWVAVVSAMSLETQIWVSTALVGLSELRALSPSSSTMTVARSAPHVILRFWWYPILYRLPSSSPTISLRRSLVPPPEEMAYSPTPSESILTLYTPPDLPSRPCSRRYPGIWTVPKVGMPPRLEYHPPMLTPPGTATIPDTSGVSWAHMGRPVNLWSFMTHANPDLEFPHWTSAKGLGGWDAWGVSRP